MAAGRRRPRIASSRSSSTAARSRLVDAARQPTGRARQRPAAGVPARLRAGLPARSRWPSRRSRQQRRRGGQRARAAAPRRRGRHGHGDHRDRRGRAGSRCSTPGPRRSSATPRRRSSGRPPTCSTPPDGDRAAGRPSSAYRPTLADVALCQQPSRDVGPRDWRYVRKDGQVRTMSMTLATMTDNSGAVLGYLSTAEDITERVRAQRALETALQTERRAVAHLTEIDRTKDAFVSSVSHELRTPITNIVGYLELLIDGAYGETTARPARGPGPHRLQQPSAARADRQPAHPLQPGVARRPAAASSRSTCAR